MSRALATGLTAALTASATAWGCKCDPDPARDPRQHPAIVFEGRVLQVAPRLTPRRTPLWGRLVHFEVTHVLQGEVGSPMAILTGEGNGDCGLDVHEGESWVISAIANERDASQGFYADICTASFKGQKSNPVRGVLWGALALGVLLFTGSLVLLRRR